jgi:hypothetical protein
MLHLFQFRHDTMGRVHLLRYSPSWPERMLRNFINTNCKTIVNASNNRFTPYDVSTYRMWKCVQILTAGTFCYVATCITRHSDRLRVAAGGAALAAVSISRWSVNITFLTHYTNHSRCWTWFPYARRHASHISYLQSADFLLVNLGTIN